MNGGRERTLRILKMKDPGGIETLMPMSSLCSAGWEHHLPRAGVWK